MSIEPKTGFIRAWVGGINHKYFKYDHVKQGRRQPGSTIKPIVYAAAIEMQMTLLFMVLGDHNSISLDIVLHFHH